jgi:D-galactarolactone isomerase
MPVAPKLKTPAGACDWHMHIFDARFPLAKHARRKEADATVSQYRKVQQHLGLERVIVVQPTAYGKDNRCTLAAVSELGECARGIAVVDNNVTDAELERLTRGGMRRVRFRMLDTSELGWALLPEMAARLASFGWHVQFQMDGRFFEDRAELLRRLLCTLVIEHIGKFPEPVLPDHRGFQSLLRILESGRCWVKLSGAYMMSKSGPPLYEDIGILAKALVQRAPERLVWASNWPHPLSGAHGLPDDATLLDTLLDWAPDADTRNRILAQNPAELYGFGS